MTVSTQKQGRGHAWRILMFAPECYPVSTAESIVAYKLLAAMLDAGWNVETLCHRDIRRSYPDDEGLGTTVREACTMIRGTFFARTQDGSSLLRRKGGSWVWTGRAVLAALRQVRERRPDFLFSRVMPQYGHMPALILTAITGIPWVANWSDPMPHAIAPEPFGKGPDARIASFHRLYCLNVVKRAAWHTFPSDGLREYMCRVFPGLRGKSSVVPHIAYSKLTSADRPVPGNFAICYAGGFGRRDPRTFFQAVKAFVERSQPAPPFSVQLIGPVEDHVNRIVSDFGLGAVVRSTGSLPYVKALEKMARSAVGVIVEANCTHPVFLPSKLADCVQAGLPILAITPPHSELAKLIALHGGGVAADCCSWQQILRGLLALHDAWQKGTLGRVYSVARLRSEFSESRILQTYDDLLTNLRIQNDSERAVERTVESGTCQDQS